jgi:hypothetical protein
LKKIIYENTATIHSVLKKKYYKAKFSINSILKKIKSTNLILEKNNKKNIGKKNHVGNIVVIHNVL